MEIRTSYLSKAILFTASFVLSACASSSSGSGGGSSEQRDAGATGAGGRSSKSVSFAGLILEAPAFTPSAGTEGCVLDSDPPVCATSGSDGMITVPLPANSRTGFLLTPADAIPILSPVLTYEEDITLPGGDGWTNPAAGVVIPNGAAQLIAAALGATIDPSKSYVDFSAGQLNGGRVTIIGGTTATEWYLENGAPVLAEGQGGGALPADAALDGFVNLEPGMVTFRAEKNGKACEWDPVVWPGKEPGTVTVPLRAGTWTRLFEVRCE